MAYKISGVGKRSKSAAMSLTMPTAQEANAKAQGLRSNGRARFAGGCRRLSFRVHFMSRSPFQPETILLKLRFPRVAPSAAG
jgi:hypothetical protein